MIIIVFNRCLVTATLIPLGKKWFLRLKTVRLHVQTVVQYLMTFGSYWWLLFRRQNLHVQILFCSHTNTTFDSQKVGRSFEIILAYFKEIDPEWNFCLRTWKNYRAKNKG